MAEDPDGSEVLDPAALARLDRLGGERLVRRMVELFVELGEVRVAAAREGLASGDLDAVERAAHSLKSSAGNLGAGRLQAVAERVETRAERAGGAGAGDGGLEDLVDRLAAAFAEARRALEESGKVSNMKTIAHVEENPDNRLLVSAILGARYRLVEYASGPEALEGFRREKPDLVLLDISMPEMDGTEVLRRMRSEAGLRDVPVIGVSAHAMAGDREKYLEAGFDDYVTKPIVDEDVLIHAIERQLE